MNSIWSKRLKEALTAAGRENVSKKAPSRPEALSNDSQLSSRALPEADEVLVLEAGSNIAIYE
jgi:hypothetical protein